MVWTWLAHFPDEHANQQAAESLPHISDSPVWLTEHLIIYIEGFMELKEKKGSFGDSLGNGRPEPNSLLWIKPTENLKFSFCLQVSFLVLGPLSLVWLCMQQGTGKDLSTWNTAAKKPLTVFFQKRGSNWESLLHVAGSDTIACLRHCCPQHFPPGNCFSYIINLSYGVYRKWEGVPKGTTSLSCLSSSICHLCHLCPCSSYSINWPQGF